jgi:hypothetical protein
MYVVGSLVRSRNSDQSRNPCQVENDQFDKNAFFNIIIINQLNHFLYYVIRFDSNIDLICVLCFWRCFEREMDLSQDEAGWRYKCWDKFIWHKKLYSMNVLSRHTDERCKLPFYLQNISLSIVRYYYESLMSATGAQKAVSCMFQSLFVIYLVILTQN